MERIGVYPGSFDPITNGHLDIIKRASKLFDKVVVLIAVNKAKGSRFSIEERLNLITTATDDIPNVEVAFYDGLTVDYAKKIGACALIRGIRVVSDFEYEWQLAAANEYIDSSIEIVFLISHKETTFISSSTIDDLYHSGVDIGPLVPKCVIDLYKQKYSK